MSEFMAPADVAALLGVHPKTVTRWSRAGILREVRTPGGHRRYRRADVEALVGQGRRQGPLDQGPGLTYLYRVWDDAGVLLYVGITTDVSRRLEEHARAPWWPGDGRALVRLEGPYSATRALAEESLAILREGPRYNVTGAPVGP